jgi:hypothetical protein
MRSFGWRAWTPAVLLAGFGLMGCGLTVPDIKEVWDADKPADPQTQSPRIPGTAQIEFEVKKRVFCELGDAVKYVNQFSVQSGSSPSTLKPFAKYVIPLDWIAQISLSFQVDESSALNPGVTLNTVLPNAVKIFSPGSSGTVVTSQSRMLGLGGTLSSTATRIDKFDPSYTITNLMKANGPNSVCRDGNDPFTSVGWQPASSSPFILEGNLGIQDWLLGAMLTDTFIGSDASGGPASGGPKTDAVSYEVKFVIVSSGSITPTWKLVNVSANTSGTFFSAGRTRTHDLIITIGAKDNRTLYSHLYQPAKSLTLGIPKSAAP